MKYYVSMAQGCVAKTSRQIAAVDVIAHKNRTSCSDVSKKCFLVVNKFCFLFRI